MPVFSTVWAVRFGLPPTPFLAGFLPILYTNKKQLELGQRRTPETLSMHPRQYALIDLTGVIRSP